MYPQTSPLDCVITSVVWFQSNRNSIPCNLSLVGTATSIICVVTNILLQQNTSIAATKICLSRQNYVSQQPHVCCDKTFVATNICRNKSVVVTSTLLSQQTCLLSQQKCACCNKSFVMTSIHLSQKQKFCHDKHTFVMRKDVCPLSL